MVTLAAGDRKEDLKLKLTPTGAITGRILDAEGEPIPGADVRAEGPRGSYQASSDEQGRYRIGGLNPGKYRIRAAPKRQPLRRGDPNRWQPRSPLRHHVLSRLHGA